MLERLTANRENVVKSIPLVELQAQRRRLGARIDDAILRVCEHANFIMGDEVKSAEAVEAMFDYDAQAELFSARNRKSGRQSSGYKRFDRAADAIRFAIEELPPEQLLRAHLEVEESRFDSNGIRRLYDAPAYPLARRDAGALL